MTSCKSLQNLEQVLIHQLFFTQGLNLSSYNPVFWVHDSFVRPVRDQISDGVVPSNIYVIKIYKNKWRK